MTRIRHALAIGIALAALCAGCSANGGVTDQTTPVDQVDDQLPSAVIVQRDFQIRYVLDAVTEWSPAVLLFTHPQLDLVTDLDDGALVARGDALGSIIVVSSLAEATGSGRVDAARLAQLRSVERSIVAPVSGTLRLLGPHPSIESTGIDVVATLGPIQALRLQAVLFAGQASVETTMGERVVACSVIWIEPAGPDRPDASLRCRLPDHIETVPQLRARLVVEAPRVDNAVVVPNLYIGYDAEVDEYYVVVDDSGPRVIPVSVGATDGVVRVITSEVPVGATLLLPSEVP